MIYETKKEENSEQTEMEEMKDETHHIEDDKLEEEQHEGE